MILDKACDRADFGHSCYRNSMMLLSSCMHLHRTMFLFY